jgi:hypothetical protein
VFHPTRRLRGASSALFLVSLPVRLARLTWV